MKLLNEILNKDKTTLDRRAVKLAYDGVRRAIQSLKADNKEAALEDLNKVMKTLAARESKKQG